MVWIDFAAGGIVMETQYEISDRKLSAQERALFSGSLRAYGVDEAVWCVFDSFLASASAVTKPKILRARRGSDLAGVAFFIECLAGGASLFKNRMMAGLVNVSKIRSYLWFRQGICADLMANPGFVVDGYDVETLQKGMIDFLSEASPALFITDLAANESMHNAVARFPYTREGAVGVEGMEQATDFVRTHKKLKRKIKIFTKNGGTIEVVKGPLPDSIAADVIRCVLATMKASFVRTPFQDHFPTMIGQSCAVESDELIHIIARIQGAFVGYHSFVRSGNGLRMLHGAFDRTRDSLYHAYENLIARAAEHAIEHGLEAVHFGPIMNETKRRMMNRQEKTGIFFYSNSALFRKVLPSLYRKSSMQNPKLLAFS